MKHSTKFEHAIKLQKMKILFFWKFGSKKSEARNNLGKINISHIET